MCERQRCRWGSSQKEQEEKEKEQEEKEEREKGQKEKEQTAVPPIRRQVSDESVDLGNVLGDVFQNDDDEEEEEEEEERPLSSEPKLESQVSNESIDQGSLFHDVFDETPIIPIPEVLSNSTETPQKSEENKE